MSAAFAALVLALCAVFAALVLALCAVFAPLVFAALALALCAVFAALAFGRSATESGGSGPGGDCRAGWAILKGLNRCFARRAKRRLADFADIVSILSGVGRSLR